MRDARTFTGRLPASVQDCILYLRGLGGMSGLVSDAGKMAAAFGPMGSASAGPSASPTHFYRLENTSWTDTGTGTQRDLTASASAPTINTGHIGNAAYFASSGPNYLTYADNAEFEMNKNYTLFGWVYLDSITVSKGICAKGNNFTSNYEWTVYVNNAADSWLSFLVSATGAGGTVDAKTVTGTTFGPLSTGVWYFWAARRNTGVSIQVSVNGGTWNTESWAFADYTNNSPFYVGCRGFHNATILSPMDGRIDAVALFPGSAVSDADVTAAYNGGTGLEYYSGAWH